MTQFQAWIQSPAAIAVARTLLHSLWQAAFAALALAFGLRFIHTSRLRYAAACAALSAIVLLSIGTLVVVTPQAGLERSSRELESSRPVSQVAGPADGFVGLPANPVERLLPWITPVWLAGCLLFSLCRAAGWSALRRLRRRSISDVPQTWMDTLNRIRVRMKVARAVALLESGLTRVPLVIGHLRPAILIPVGLLTGLPAEQLELILMHEMAHIRRCDYLVNMLQTFVEGLMFYNPAVWWVSSVIRTERENCCDDVVVESTNKAPLYASALAALEEIRSDQREVVMAAAGGSLVKRIRRILRQSEPQTSTLIPVLSAVGLIVVIGGLLAAHPAGQLPQGRIAFPNLYAIWLEEDVVYIITAQERAAFLGLSTDAQRDQFIEQFWQRRDPTPGTRENEYKEEHYRRIAYANEHFTSSLPAPAGAGWRTDRGRIYIMYGKPDEIESHPSGGKYDRPIQEGGGTITTFPFEIWRYAYIEGIGRDVLLEFVDTNGTAEFRLTIDPAAKENLLKTR
jgi:GWxTD domain-containing protein